MRYIAEYCYWAQVVVLLMYLDFDVFGTGFLQVLYFGRAPHTKGTLPNFHEKRRVTRHSRVFRGLTGSERTLGKWGVTKVKRKKHREDNKEEKWKERKFGGK